MIGKLSKLFGSGADGALKKMGPIVDEVNDLEPSFEALSDDELRNTTEALKARLDAGETLDDLLPSAFAAVREASRRSIGLRHFDVQIIGGVVLHQGKISEMKTGEGKTLVAPLAVYLNALAGKGVHVVTVNDYLARRDVQWMGPVYHQLGLSVSSLQHEGSLIYSPNAPSDQPALRFLTPITRRDAYEADITYGTNHEFGFDYLRDNMAVDADRVVQRGLNYAIVDEVDYILIDEARTPLIISGAAQEATQLYSTMARVVPRLQEEDDYTVDEKQKSISLTEEGIAKMEQALGVDNLYDPGNYQMTHFIENALRARVIFGRDRDYVVQDGNIVLVDEFTGRLMEGRRFSDGLHQALEAKEGVKVQQESITYASVTLQNYFRMYEKLAGMTGTALTEAAEFTRIYRLEVAPIPSHREMVRGDHSDFVFKSSQAKWQAIANDIEEAHEAGRPVLVGTTSIENSEMLSGMLLKRGVTHQVLNAKNHEREATIVAHAGRAGAVTVATNMAGRGTDIILGGNPDSDLSDELRKAGYPTPEAAPAEMLEKTRASVQARWRVEHERVVALEGLYVLGTEKHEARRIDNQLRGRSGRQGDPGDSRFYVSLEDDLMRRFGGDRIKGFMNLMGIAEDQPLEAGMVTKALGTVQTKVEAHNFEIRKNLVEYDDVINRHREVIYAERRKILEEADLKTNVLSMVEGELNAVLDAFIVGRDPSGWDLDGLVKELRVIFPLPPDLDEQEMEQLSGEELHERVQEHASDLYAQREEAVGPEMMRALERLVMLRTIDSHWVQHLTTMENLRQGVGLQAYGQRDPLVAYRAQGHELFQAMLESIQHDIAHTIYHVSLTQQQQPQAAPHRHGPALRAVRPSPMAAMAPQRQAVATAPSGGAKVGRNAQCPCGSGKKYKKCHGAAA